MFHSVRLGSLFGVPVTAHWSLLMLAGLACGWGWGEYGMAGVGVVSGLLVLACCSVLAHEFGHVLAARHYGAETTSVNLSPLGGIAFMTSIPTRPAARAAIAAAGPAASLVICIMCAMFFLIVPEDDGRSPLFAFGMALNGMLFAFNLLPAYPMDGGRLLDAALRAWKGPAFARKASLAVGGTLALAMFVAGFWTGIYSLVLAGAFVFLAGSAELGSAWVARFSVFLQRRAGRRVARRFAHVSPPGVFVAFDGEGRHFAYARHWRDCPGDEEDQMAEIARYSELAAAAGGELRYLTGSEFREMTGEG